MEEPTTWRSDCASMVRDTVAARGVRDESVLEAMRNVPRHRFVPDAYRAEAYLDRPLPLEAGQSISQPYIVAAMAELAGVEKGLRVLDVGTGSGYQTAVLAQLGAEVYTIERVPELAEAAQRTLDEVGITGVRLRTGDGREGWPEAAPFDVILVAAATRRIPEPLIDQLAVGGRLLIPVGDDSTQELVLLEHLPWGEIRRSSLMRVLFVPLV